MGCSSLMNWTTLCLKASVDMGTTDTNTKNDLKDIGSILRKVEYLEKNILKISQQIARLQDEIHVQKNDSETISERNFR